MKIPLAILATIIAAIIMVLSAEYFENKEAEQREAAMTSLEE